MSFFAPPSTVNRVTGTFLVRVLEQYNLSGYYSRTVSYSKQPLVSRPQNNLFARLTIPDLKMRECRTSPVPGKIVLLPATSSSTSFIRSYRPQTGIVSLRQSILVLVRPFQLVFKHSFLFSFNSKVTMIAPAYLHQQRQHRRCEDTGCFRHRSSTQIYDAPGVFCSVCVCEGYSVAVHRNES